MIFVASSLLKSPVWGSACARLERRSSVVTPTTYSSLVVSVASRESPSYIPQFPFACEEKYLKNNKHNGLHLAPIYSQIFVLGQYLFLKAHSFPRASQSKHCSLLETDNIRGQISENINVEAIVGGYCLFHVHILH